MLAFGWKMTAMRLTIDGSNGHNGDAQHIRSASVDEIVHLYQRIRLTSASWAAQDDVYPDKIYLCCLMFAFETNESCYYLSLSLIMLAPPYRAIPKRLFSGHSASFSWPPLLRSFALCTNEFCISILSDISHWKECLCLTFLSRPTENCASH